MNVGDLLKERDRLIDLIADAKAAKLQLRQVNILIAMYSGEDEKVDLVANGDLPASDFCVFGDNKPVKFRGVCSSHYTKLRNGQLSREELALIPPGRTHAGSRRKKGT